MGPMGRPSPHFSNAMPILGVTEELMTWLWISKVLAWLDIIFILLLRSAKSFATLKVPLKTPLSNLPLMKKLFTGNPPIARFIMVVSVKLF